MTPDAFAALGARLLLVQRFHFPMQAVVALSDEDAITVASAWSAAVSAADQAADCLAGGAPCRTEVHDGAYARNASGDRGHADNRDRQMGFQQTAGHTSDLGRWPTNVILSHGEQCTDACAPSCPVAELDRQSGMLASGANPTRRGSDKFQATYGEFEGDRECTPARGADSGGASRFFPTFRYEAKASSSERPRLADGTQWPTVKPIELLTSSTRLKAGDSSLRSEGFLLQRRLPAGTSPLRSYIGSTGVHREPRGGQKVPCGVDVAVVDRTARADPFADVQRHLLGKRPAARAHLARREPAVDHDQAPAVPGALVLQHAAQLGPGRIRDRAGETVVLDHVGHGQVLDHDRLVLANEPSRQLVQVVAAPVADPGVHARDLHPGLVSVRRAGLLARQVPLGLGQLLPVALLVLGVADLLAVGQRGQRRQAYVDADRAVRRGGQRLDHVVAQHRHEPAARTVARHGHGRRLHARRQRTRPDDVQRLAHLRERQLPVPVPEPGSGVLGRELRLLPRFELRVPGAFGEEVRVRRVQVPQGLLQRDARDLGEERGLVGALPLRQASGAGRVAQARPVELPCFGALVQGLVVHEPDAAEGAAQLLSLLSGGVEAELECPLDLLRHASHSIRSLMFEGGAAFPPPREREGIHAANPMRWLLRLVTPPGGTILDPFCGTGTTGEAAILEGFRCILIEKDPVAADLAVTRLSKPLQPSLFGDVA